jgi:hypothetical protein
MGQPAVLSDYQGWTTVKLITAPSGAKRLLVQEKDGMFRFLVERFYGPAEEDEGIWPDGFWTEEGYSGYFGTAEEAELGASHDPRWIS